VKLVQIPFSLPGHATPESNPRNRSIVHRAKWIVVDPWTIFENGYLHVAFDTIIEVGSGSPPPDVSCIDHGPVVLMPTCVNAHTHLELSALKGNVPLNQGFRAWVKHLLKKRDTLSADSLHTGVITGIEELITGGCRLVGDISSLGLTIELLQKESVAGICFLEYLGHLKNFKTDLPESTDYLKAGLAGHAPHTTSPELLQEIKLQSRKSGGLMSIHVAESEDEVSFITTGNGPWANFLTQRQIDFSGWPLPAKSPVAYLSDLGILDSKTLAVHLIFIDKKDVDILRQHRVHICLCPRSNYALHHQLPDIEKLLSAGLRPCLGTDSLASVSSLSILDEMSFMASKFQDISPETILAMGTINGADALGYANRFGTLHPGRFGTALSVPVDCDHKRDLIEAIIHHNETEI
jgi:aminodeoxyfutalosine deaminase